VVFGIEKKIEFYLGSTTTRKNDARHAKYGRQTRSNVGAIKRRCRRIETSRAIIDTSTK
jgi:hypothetical protein